MPDAARVIKEFNKLGFFVVVITNQAVVARGMIDIHGIDEIHHEIARLSERDEARIDSFYFCPHHPEAALKEYRLKCDCRKPEPGLIKQAVRDLDINPRESWMIGDAVMDIVSGKRAGTRTILVKTGPGHASDGKFNDVRPDFVAKNLSEAADIIKKSMSNG